MQHPEHGVGNVAIDGAPPPIPIHPPTPQQFAVGAKNLFKRGGFHVDAAVVDRGVGRCHLEQGLLVGANGQGIEMAEFAGQANPQAVGRFNHLVEAQLLQQAHRHGVERVLHRHHHRDRAHVAVAEVAGAVAGKAAGGIDHDPLGSHALFEGREIHKQLEGGAGRAQGIHGAVELALGKVLAAHHRPHQAGARFHGHQGAFHLARGIGVDRLLGLALPGQIEAAFHREPAHFQLLLGEHLGEFLLHPAGEVGRLAFEVLGFGGLELEGGGVGFGLLLITDEACFPHAPQHNRPAFKGEPGIHQGGIHRGSRWQARDQRRLAEGELVGGFGEVDPGGIGHAIGAGAQIHHIQILGEDLLFAELALELAGQGHFRHFAQHGAVLAEEHGARQLLGDGAGPFLHRVLGEVAHHGPGNAHGINAVVFVKPPIFRRNEGLLHQGRHRACGDLFAGGRANFLHHLAVGREDRERARAIERTDAAGIR